MRCRSNSCKREDVTNGSTTRARRSEVKQEVKMEQQETIKTTITALERLQLASCQLVPSRRMMTSSGKQEPKEKIDRQTRIAVTFDPDT